VQTESVWQTEFLHNKLEQHAHVLEVFMVNFVHLLVEIVEIQLIF
jgi:hypothetical protein